MPFSLRQASRLTRSGKVVAPWRTPPWTRPNLESPMATNKSGNDRGDDDYIGYRKPPRHKQIKPGHSSNVKGRPRGPRNFSAVLQAVLNEKITIKEGGKLRT